MEFLTSTILSGVAWDAIKQGVLLTGEYLKKKLSDWVMDKTDWDKIAAKINGFDEMYKKSEKFIEAAIEDDTEVKTILEKAKNISQISHSVSNVDMKESVMHNGDNNTIVIYPRNTKNDNDIKKSRGEIRQELRKEIQMLLMENRQIFQLYGPTDRNKSDILSKKPEIWRKMAKKSIVPNNQKIINILQKHIDMLDDDEKEIFIQFKLHADGFRENQELAIRNSEYPRFPEKINSILR